MSDEFSYKSDDCCGTMNRRGRLTMSVEGKVILPKRDVPPVGKGAVPLKPRLVQDQPEAKM